MSIVFTQDPISHNKLSIQSIVVNIINLVFSRVGSSFVGGGDVFGVLGNTLVDDVSDEARVAIDLVGDDLSAAVGKSNPVRASDNLAIARLLVAEVVV